MASYNEFAAIPGTIRNDAFHFTLRVNGRVVPNMILDTGAFELTFSEAVAKKIGLPHLGSVQIQGVGGRAQAYRSVCNLTLGKKSFSRVPCIVDPGLGNAGLFGLRFFVDNGLSLLLDVPNAELLLLN